MYAHSLDTRTLTHANRTIEAQSIEMLEGRLQSADGAARQEALCDLAERTFTSDPARAEALAAEALELAEPASDDCARALAIRAEARITLGSTEAGIEDAARAIEVTDPNGAPAVQAAAHSAAAHGYGRLYRLAESQSHMERSLELYRTAGDELGIALATMRLGILAYERGEYLRSEELYKECLPALRRLGREDRVGAVLANLSLMRYDTGHIGEGIEMIRESLALAERLGQPFEQAIRAHNLGTYLAACGRYPAALVALRKSQDLYGDHRESWRPRFTIAHVYDRIGLHEKARDASDAAIALARAASERMGEGLALLARASVLGSAENWSGAQRALDEALAIFEELDARARLSDCHFGLADVHEKNGKRAEAMAELRSCIAIARNSDDPAGLHAALGELGRLLDADGATEEADAAFEEARTIIAGMDPRSIEPRFHFALAEHDRARGDFGRAFESFRLFHDEAAKRTEAEIEARRMVEPSLHDIDSEAEAWQRRYEDQSDVMRSVMHDIRNALLGISGAASLGLQDLSRPDVGGKLEAIGSSAERMIQMLERVREPSTFDPGRTITQSVAFDLDWLARGAIEDHTAAAEAKQIEVELQPCDEPARVRADPARCREVLDNIISNAVKFTPPRGHVIVRIEPSAIVVEDTGPGFKKADYARMFDRFARLSARPTASEPAIGLGLYVARGHMKAMGGDVVCESGVGESARMRIRWSSEAT